MALARTEKPCPLSRRNAPELFPRAPCRQQDAHAGEDQGDGGEIEDADGAGIEEQTAEARPDRLADIDAGGVEGDRPARQGRKAFASVSKAGVS